MEAANFLKQSCVMNLIVWNIVSREVDSFLAKECSEHSSLCLLLLHCLYFTFLLIIIFSFYWRHLCFCCCPDLIALIALIESLTLVVLQVFWHLSSWLPVFSVVVILLIVVGVALKGHRLIHLSVLIIVHHLKVSRHGSNCKTRLCSNSGRRTQLQKRRCFKGK